MEEFKKPDSYKNINSSQYKNDVRIGTFISTGTKGK